MESADADQVHIENRIEPIMQELSHDGLKGEKIMFSGAYQYFLAVARTGSFHKASQELHISQPAVSKQIKALEEKLGYPLFLRTTRMVSLTPEGKVLYAALLECMQIMNAAQDKIAEGRSKRALSGTLRIGILSNWEIDHFRMPYITGFFQENPGVELLLERLDHKEMIERLKENRLDVILTPLRELDNYSGISFVSIGEYPFMLIVSTKHPLASYDSIMDKLDGVNLYTHHKERGPVISNLNKIGIHPNVVLVPNVDSKIAAAENGQGCTVVVSCSKAVRSPGIRAYPLSGVTLELVVAYRDNEDQIINAFLNYVTNLKKHDTGS